MASRDLVVRIDGDDSGFSRSMKSAAASASVFERELKKVEAAQAKRQQAMGQLGKAGMAAGAAMAAGLALAANAAIKWESAWAGVTKTVNGSDKEMAALEGQLRDMAKSLPATHGEIAAVAEAAGQLGVKREDIAGFTKTMIDLGVSTNLTADQAATSIAQFANVMGTMDREGSKGVERLGATLVALGNAGASTEADIMDMAARLAGAGKLVGASESDILALANAMASMGVEAENGGGVMTRTLLKVYQATKQGGDELNGFAKIAGMSAASFQKAFGTDPIRATDAFVKGLGRIDSAGGDVVGALADVGITGSRDLQVLLSLKGAGDLLTDSLDLGNKAWKDNTALVNEANKRYDTTASKLKVAKNEINDMAINIGATVLPAIGKLAGGVSDLADMLGSLPAPAQQALSALGVIGATVGILGGAALVAVPKIAAMKTALTTLGVSAEATNRIMSALAGTMKAGLAVGAIAGAGLALADYYSSLADAAPGVQQLTASLLDFNKTGVATGTLAKITGGDIGNLGKMINEAGKSKWGVLADQTKIQQARNDVKALDQALSGLVATGHEDIALNLVSASGITVKQAADQLPLYTDAVAGASNETKLAKKPVQDFNTALGATKEEAEAAQKAIDDLSESTGKFIEPMQAYNDVLKTLQEQDQARAEKSAAAQNDSVDSKIKAVQREYDHRLKVARDTKGISDAAIQKIEDERDATVEALGKQKKSWQDYSDGVTVSVAAYLAELDKQVAAQRDWQKNMLLLSGRVSADTLAELGKLGPEGAPLVAALATASDKQLAKLEADFRARSKAATDAFAAELLKANPVLTYLSGKLGADAAQALAVKLAAGKTTIEAIMKQYGITIQNGVVVPVVPPPRAAPGAPAAAKKIGQMLAAQVQAGLGTLFVTPVAPPSTSPTTPDGLGPYATPSGGKTWADLYGLPPAQYAPIPTLPAGTPGVRKAAGGYISGPGTGTSDSIPAYLSNGEYVVNAAATHRHRPELEAMNSGVRGFAAGGLVGHARPVTSTAAGLSEASVDRIVQALQQRPTPHVTVNAQTNASAASIVDEAVFAARVGRL